LPRNEPELDDRNDVKIVADGACRDIFVIDDRNLLDRLLFFRARRCIHFAPMNTAEFLRTEALS
jgi:hypothetical protein